MSPSGQSLGILDLDGETGLDLLKNSYPFCAIAGLTALATRWRQDVFEKPVDYVADKFSIGTEEQDERCFGQHRLLDAGLPEPDIFVVADQPGSMPLGDPGGSGRIPETSVDDDYLDVLGNRCQHVRKDEGAVVGNGHHRDRGCGRARGRTFLILRCWFRPA